ncbi:MAG: hypothetical protein FWC16_05395 [Defluviitaleaceae bacterium]|nr:hypothetical protein [Defluviitaleaceae bacterium]MCL2274343.1 hypothetical protein [Defluviitaleaceae bacterium]
MKPIIETGWDLESSAGSTQVEPAPAGLMFGCGGGLVGACLLPPGLSTLCGGGGGGGGNNSECANSKWH